MLVVNRPSSSSSDLSELETVVVVEVEKFCQLTKTPPNITIISIQLENALKIFNSFMKLFLRSENRTDRIHGGNGPGIRAKRMFVSTHGLVEASKQFC